ncbi:MAG: tetratricopeptide repeat protein, partial [Candidatus Microthrix parvicella]
TAELAGGYTDAASLLRSALPADVTHPDGWPSAAVLDPHVRVLLEGVDQAESPSVELAMAVRLLADRVATARQYGGDNRSAVPLFEVVERFAHKFLGVDHPDTLTARANLASSYWQAGRTNDAITIEERVVEDRERLIGVDHPSTLTARANLASSYRQAGRTNDAITLLQEVVDRQDGVIGPDHPDAVAHREALVGWRREADER